MAYSTWTEVKRIDCEQVGAPVALLEERVYPGNDIIEFGRPPFRVRARKCSTGVACNLAGYKCVWSGLNPDYDPFKS